MIQNQSSANPDQELYVTSQDASIQTHKTFQELYVILQDNEIKSFCQKQKIKKQKQEIQYIEISDDDSVSQLSKVILIKQKIEITSNVFLDIIQQLNKKATFNNIFDKLESKYFGFSQSTALNIFCELEQNGSIFDINGCYKIHQQILQDIQIAYQMILKTQQQYHEICNQMENEDNQILAQSQEKSYKYFDDKQINQQSLDKFFDQSDQIQQNTLKDQFYTESLEKYDHYSDQNLNNDIIKNQIIQKDVYNELVDYQMLVQTISDEQSIL